MPGCRAWQKHKSMQMDVLVIGAGASGLMAAGTAATRGRKVVILEKMPRPARKLRITGKGRCNLTNIAPVSEFMKHIGPDSRFLKYTFSEFFSKDLIEFFNKIGIATVTEQGGRVFPESENAQDIVDALVDWTKKLGVEIRCSSPVKRIMVTSQSASGILLENGQHIKAERIILAAGGASYPATG